MHLTTCRVCLEGEFIRGRKFGEARTTREYSPFSSGETLSWNFATLGSEKFDRVEAPSFRKLRCQRIIYAFAWNALLSPH